ncbi:MAG: IS200/IS605 family element transposase accessory protein TnpB [Campylobacterales bacterium]|nr:IS200/IS605 family element transposase accessory protein TnpB [Campylobacterales bacterium]
MLKAYKYRIYPTKEQITLIEKHFGSTRFLYNYFLEYRQKEYAHGNKKVGYMVTQAELTKLKKLKEYEWLNECGSQSLQMALRDLDAAYSRFFKKQGEYPKFKSKKHTSQSFTAPQNIKVANNRVYLPKFTKDGIKVKLHRELPQNSVLKQTTISRQNNQYFVSILIDDNNAIPKPTKAKNAVGLDMGLTDLIITSDGVKYPNNKYFVKSRQKLKKIQRRLSKKQKGSNNRNKAKLKVQKLHTKISNQKKDTLHKISNEITNQYDIICLETLNVKGMQKNRRLSKSIADVAWNEFMRQLEYKSEWKGKTVLKIDQWFPSSQICSNCGASSGEKELNIRKWECPQCHMKLDRDINASINIRNYGLGQIDQRNTIVKNTVGTIGN